MCEGGRVSGHPDRVSVEVILPEDGGRSRMAAEVREGLTRPLKEISPRYFYDELGSELFEKITELPEYYPTRCEREILRARARDIVESANPSSLIELGSGSAAKSRILLDEMKKAGSLEAYCPVDISEEITRQTAAEIAEEYDGVEVRGLISDFEHDFVSLPVDGPRLVAFLGGTIGNLMPERRAEFLDGIVGLLDPEDRFLVGVDLVKDPETLVAAYDDAKGVTAEFNLNVLKVLNRELSGNLDPEGFEHVALWDPENLWIEMRLRSLVDQQARLDDIDLNLEFDQGEEVRTEISTKFAREGLESIFAEAELQMTDWFESDGSEYALALARSARSC